MGRESPKDHQIASVASKVELDFRFGINNLKYPDIHVHFAYNSYMYYGLRGQDDLQIASMASKVKFDFRFEIIELKYPNIHVHVA